MCNMCNNYTQMGRCGYTNGGGCSTQGVCRDCCGNIWVRVANVTTPTNTCQCSGTCHYGCLNATANTNADTNNTQGSYCIDGNAYYARQYALNGQSRSCGCGYNG